MSDADATAMTRRSLLAHASVAAGGMTFGGLTAVPSAAAAWPSASAYRSDVPAAWFELALDLIRATPGFSPPVVSRALGYTGVTLYEALVPGLHGRTSLAGRLNQLRPFRPSTDVAAHWPTVANSALASILRALFPTAPTDARMAIDALEQGHATAARAVLPRGIYERSVRRGSQVAQHVFEWWRSDGGHEGFRHNFPFTYTLPTGPGLWEATSSLPALQPFWGTNRTFLLPAGEACSPTAPPPYSESPTSSFFAGGVRVLRGDDPTHTRAKGGRAVLVRRSRQHADSALTLGLDPHPNPSRPRRPT